VLDVALDGQAFLSEAERKTLDSAESAVQLFHYRLVPRDPKQKPEQPERMRSALFGSWIPEAFLRIALLSVVQDEGECVKRGWPILPSVGRGFFVRCGSRILRGGFGPFWVGNVQICFLVWRGCLGVRGGMVGGRWLGGVADVWIYGNVPRLQQPFGDVEPIFLL
jgi:hypothetical protein